MCGGCDYGAVLQRALDRELSKFPVYSWTSRGLGSIASSSIDYDRVGELTLAIQIWKWRTHQ